MSNPAVPYRFPPPCRVLSCLLMAGLALAAEPAGRRSDVIACLQPFVASKALAGAVTLVVDQERVLSQQAIGLADVAGRRPMATDALFWIASMSKPLTATELMMLVDEGRVELDAPVSRWLPEFASMQVAVTAGGTTTLQPARNPITLRQALSHTSGLPFVIPEGGGKLDVMPLGRSVALSARQPPSGEPGTTWGYSNCGINIAGRIIEVVTGRDFETVMRERLFAPLGMVDTTSFPSAAQVARLAKSYQPDPQGGALRVIPIAFLSYPLEAATRFACPGGGFFATAQDLGRFARMLLNGGELAGRRYLAAASLKTMTSMQTGALTVAYGLGFALPGDDFGHGGAYNTDLWIVTRHRLATVCMVQHDGFAGVDGDDLLTAFKQAAVLAFARR